MNMKLTPILALLAGSAYATGSHQPTQTPQETTSASSEATAAAKAAAHAQQSQKQSQGQAQGQQQGQIAAGGSAKVTTEATGGEGGSANSSADGTNSLTSSTVYQEVAQTPAALTPSILVSHCGAGVNAAGSDQGGAGAFGITWTTDKCYAFMSGSNWVALGEYEAACVVWKDVNRRAFKRQGYKPDCKAIAQRLVSAEAAKLQAATPAPAPAVDLSGYVKRDELPALFRDRDERILRQATSK